MKQLKQIKIKIKLRSVVYSLLAVLVGGTFYLMIYMQIPAPAPADIPLPEIEQSENPAKDDTENPDYPEDYPEAPPAEPGSGMEMSGYILGDNSYQISDPQIADYIAKNVFRYGRGNPMGLKAAEAAVLEPPVAAIVPIEEEKEDEIVEGDTSSGGLVIKLPNNETINLEYTSGKLPVTSDYYKISKIYGVDGSEFHYGIDISTEGIEGQEVYSVLPGIISIVGNTEDYGHYIVVNHGTVSSLYAHLSDKPLLSINDRVYTGDRLGYVGATGKTDQAQLHFEMDANGIRFNPEAFFKVAVSE